MYKNYTVDSTREPRICNKHGSRMINAKVMIDGSQKLLDICPECEKEEIIKFQEHLKQQAAIQSILANTYKVFDRESIYSNELEDKTLDNYDAGNKRCEQALNFSKRILRDYLKYETGNVILSGPPGVGKSHLSIGIAKALNEKFKECKQPKSVLFISTSALFSKIEESFNNRGDFTESYAVNLLSNVDFLFFDDLGKEQMSGDNEYCLKSWTIVKQHFLIQTYRVTILKQFTTRPLLTGSSRAQANIFLNSQRIQKAGDIDGKQTIKRFNRKSSALVL